MCLMGKSEKRQCMQQGFCFVSRSCGTCVLFYGSSALSFRVLGRISRVRVAFSPRNEEGSAFPQNLNEKIINRTKIKQNKYYVI